MVVPSNMGNGSFRVSAAYLAQFSSRIHRLGAVAAHARPRWVVAGQTSIVLVGAFSV